MTVSPDNGKVRVLIIGDSLVAKGAFGRTLQRELQALGNDVAREAIGATSARTWLDLIRSGASCFPRDRGCINPANLQAEWDLFVIVLGTNDAANAQKAGGDLRARGRTTADRVKQIAGLVKAKRAIWVLPPRLRKPPYYIQSAADVVYATAGESGLELFDSRPSTEGVISQGSGDGIHPGSDVATAWARAFVGYLKGSPPEKATITNTGNTGDTASAGCGAYTSATTAPVAGQCSPVTTVGAATTVTPGGATNPAAASAVANARQELEYWGGGTLKEPYDRSNQPDSPNFQKAFDRLFLYWKNLGGSDTWIKESRIKSKSAWSAAAISYFHRHDPSFPKAGGHQKYMRAAKANRDQGAQTGYIAYRPEEIKELVPGDIVCAGRSQDGSGISTWERIQPFNHCDLCIARDQAVGGNVSNTVKISKIEYVNGVPTKLGTRNSGRTPIMMVIRKAGSSTTTSLPTTGSAAGDDPPAAPGSVSQRALGSSQSMWS